MGMPDAVSFSDHLKALTTALDVSRNFRGPLARIQALEFLRGFLKPMADEFALPLKHQGLGSRADARVLYLGMIGRDSICLARDSQWRLLDAVDTVRVVTSKKVAALIAESAYSILGFYGHPTEEEDELRAIPGVRDAVNHAAFVVCVVSWFDKIDHVLREREERQRILREHWALGRLAVQGFDPCQHAGEARLPGFSLFQETGRGTSRASGTYFVKQPVDDEVADKNVQGGDTYFVFNDSWRLATVGLPGVIRGVLGVLKAVGSRGQFGRSPLSEAERAALESFFASLGT